MMIPLCEIGKPVPSIQVPKRTRKRKMRKRTMNIRKRKKRKTLSVRLRHSALQALPPEYSPLAQDTKQSRKYSTRQVLPSGHYLLVQGYS